MSTSQNSDPRLDQAAVTDESLLVAHEKAAGKQPDDGGHYRLMPLALLFVFSGFILFAGTYLGQFGGGFDPAVYDERGHSKKGKDATTAAAPADPLVLGKNVYNQVCMACHQATGQGLPGAFPPLAGSEWANGSEDRAIRIVLHGLQGPIKVKGADFNGAMPATGPGSGFNLNPEKIAAVLTYVRQEWGNSAPPVSPAKVAEIRAQEGNRVPWTAAELEKIP
ncbi:MAG TPA: cytochrome c [Opitutaceae bacterium]|nr:cytochrome c [Opitutaceae bacterium]